MPVSVIFENLEAGPNIDDILEWFRSLRRDQVQEVIGFAARSLDEPPSNAPEIFSSIKARRFLQPLALPDTLWASRRIWGGTVSRTAIFLPPLSKEGNPSETVLASGSNE